MKIKYNRGKENSIENRGSNRRRVKFVTEFEHIENRVVDCLCSKCFNILGDLDFQFTYFYTLRSKKISDEVMYNDIIPKFPFLDTFTSYCKECGERTVHFTVDYNLGKVVQHLNRAGCFTQFCCEGHDPYNNTPYIAFQNNVNVPEYFDMDNPLLKYWYIDNLEYRELDDLEKTNECYAMYISKDAPIEYIWYNEYLKDLQKYVKKFIPLEVEKNGRKNKRVHKSSKNK